MDNRTEPNANVRNTTLIALVAVIAALYFARIVLIPLALAVLIAFILTPLVLYLRRWKIGRIPSVLAVAILATVLIVGVTVTMFVQLADLAGNLPEYQQNIQAKVKSVRESSGGVISRFSGAVHNITTELTPDVSAEPKPGEEKPMPVEIRKGPFSPIEIVGGVLGSVVHGMISLSVVLVFVLFMLFQREDLRDRMLRLAGTGRLNITTRALDEAARRVSRYLITQLLVNAIFGVLAAVALFFLDVPNPLLWGALAILLRYVPYLGIWLAAALPAALAVAIHPGWFVPVAIFAIYFGIDIFIINLLEPLLYGNSAGISPMAIVVAAVFWTWLWGPVGLLLATPLTVCLAVLGRYVPSLEFLSVLLSDEPVLTGEKRLYQRLLARDVEEATEVIEESLKGKSLEELYDNVVLPALRLAETDRHNGRLDAKQGEFILENARLLVDEFAERAEAAAPAETVIGDAEPAAERSGCDPDWAAVTVLCIPARDQADEIGALMLAQLLRRRGISVKTSPPGLASECLQEVAQEHGKVVCVCAVPPLGYMHVRYLCKRLRGQFPETKLIAVIFDQPHLADIKRRQPAIAADEIVASLHHAVACVLSLLPAARENAGQTAFSS